MRINLWSKPQPTRPLTELLAPLPEQFRLPLVSLYAGDRQIGSGGQLFEHDPQTRVGAEQGMWMHELCLSIQPKTTCEVGLGHGYSTLYILAAIHKNGFGTHIAIDPFQSAYHEIGLNQPKKVGMESIFELLPEKSSLGLTSLIRRERKFDLIYIDGGHRFDDVLVDFVLSAELCNLNGYVVLDDLWMASIQRVASFVRTNRSDFTEIQTPIKNIAAFKKVADDERKWDFHADF